MTRRFPFVVGCLALAAAIAAATGTAPDLFRALGTDATVYVVAVAVTLLGLLVCWRSVVGSETDRAPVAEARIEPDHGRASAPIDRALDRPDVGEGRPHRLKARRRVRTVAVDVLSDRSDLNREDAAKLVRDGEWSNDPRAAAALGFADPPLWVQLRDWFLGDRDRRQFEAAIDEVVVLADGPAGRDRDWSASHDGPAGSGAPLADIAWTNASADGPTATGRWRVGLVVALVAVGVGVIAGSTAIFLSSIVGLTYAAYGHVIPSPTTSFAVERRVEPESPDPGEPVEVVVRVTNEGANPVADVWIADEPPESLIVEGEPCGTASLRPGESATVAYAVRARRGSYEFGPVTLLAHNVSGGETELKRFDAAGEFTCDERVDGLPLTGQTIQYAGRVETDVGGEGVEFHSIRSHHPTDPMNRVDWNRLARTGELTTVEFREERAARVVVAVDVRRVNAVVRDPAELDGVALATHAADRIVEALLGENNQVGVVQYGGRGDYLLPRSGRDQLARARRLLDGEWCESFGHRRWLPWGHRNVDRFCRHLADEKQVVFVTPALDDDPVLSARQFRAYGHQVTVVSPTVVDGATPGGSIERIARERRLREFREHDVRVVEWAPDEPLHGAIERAVRRWSR